MVTHDFWKIIWESKTIPKIKNFLWRMGSNILPTKSKLFERHISDTNICPLCASDEETWHHAFFTCPKVSHLWSLLFDDNNLIPSSDQNIKDVIVR